MNDSTKGILIGFVLLILGVAGYAWWHQNMETRWVSYRDQSSAAAADPMLAAARLLRQNGRTVNGAGSLGELVVPQTAAGTMIVSGAMGTATPGQAREMLAWVRRGNTLIAEPRWISPADKALLASVDDEAGDEADETDDESEEESSDESDEGAGKETGKAPGPQQQAAAGDDASTTDAPPPASTAPPSPGPAAGDSHDSGPHLVADKESDSAKDPLTDHLGVRVRADKLACKCRTEPAYKDRKDPAAIAAARLAREQALSRLTLPGKRYALELDPDASEMVALPGAAAPLWSDSDGGAVRVYAEGKGRIVLVADGYFTNRSLAKRDHAELLLALTELTPGKHVTIVKRLNVLPWYKALWRHYKLALIALAVCLALMFWAAVRRFGPILPQPKPERRSLLEHIDASGAWLWKAEGGRQVLLDAAREDTLALIRRRVPALFRIPEAELYATLARTWAMPESDVSEALEQDAASHVTRFTRQIRTLQTLRNHYER